MKNQFVGYKESKKLSKLGFSEECFGGYLKKDKTIWIGYVSSQGGEQFNRYYHILAPTFAQAFKFFRDNYKMSETIWSHQSKWYFSIKDIITGHYFEGDSPEYKSYEETELACLVKLIEIVKEKK